MNSSHQIRVPAGVAVNATMILFIAALAEQVIHEGTHALFALLVGADLQWFNLFAVPGPPKFHLRGS